MSVEPVTASSIRDAVLLSQADVGFGFGRPKADPNLIPRQLAPLGWCTFVPKNHPYAADPGPEMWSAAKHIVVGPFDAMPRLVAAAARQCGLARHILCHAPNFNAALTLAAERGALFTTLRAPFETTAVPFGLVACTPPFEMLDAPAALMLRANYGNPFQTWLQQVCRAVV